MTERDLYESVVKRVRYEDGRLFWVKPHMRSLVGTEAGRYDSLGYRRINQGRKMLSAHRIIYFMHYGEIPDVVDHIDGDTRNNRIENLRAATRSQNSMNCKTPARNTSGVKGVYWHAAVSAWTASIRVSKVLTHLGTFNDRFDAICARKSAEAKHYGEFAR